MRVIVCGGRHYRDGSTVARVLSSLDLSGRSTIVHGAARGADSLADSWARAFSIAIAKFPADWDVCLDSCPPWHLRKGYCPSAGPRRNQQMVDANADLVIAFPGGDGTEDLVQRAKEAGITVLRVEGRL